MTIQVTGTLIDPTTQPSTNTKIRIIAVDTVDTLAGMVGEVTTDGAGAYNFQMVNGTHTVEINFSDEYKVVKDIEVTALTPSPITLPALLA